MESNINRRRLFWAASLALVVTAMTFAIRANLIEPLGLEFGLTPKEIGEVTAAAFWGFTLAMFIGGPLTDWLGLRRLFTLAFLGHLLGIILTIYSVGYWTLFISTLLVGVGNGIVEAASYAMVSSMYSDQKAKKINDWHIWFPGGIVIGGVLAYGLNLIDAGWRWQMAIMIPPTLVYGYMFYGQLFPKSERVEMGVTDKQMIKECFRPLFLFMIACMFLTAATELGTNQWIVELLADVGVPSVLLLAFINGLMAIGRANSGFFLRRFSITGVLLFSAIFSFFGLLWLSYASGYIAFLAAGVFAIGICFFWPTMIGFTSEYLPKTGPLGLSLMGGCGMLSVSLIIPYMGALYGDQLALASQALGTDQATLQAVAEGTKQALLWGQAKIQAGASTLRYVAILPGILIVAFGLLHWRFTSQEKTKASVAAEHA